MAGRSSGNWYPGDIIDGKELKFRLRHCSLSFARNDRSVMGRPYELRLCVLVGEVASRARGGHAGAPAIRRAWPGHRESRGSIGGAHAAPVRCYPEARMSNDAASQAYRRL